LKYVNYNLLRPFTINFMIPELHKEDWNADYANMTIETYENKKECLRTEKNRGKGRCIPSVKTDENGTSKMGIT